MASEECSPKWRPNDWICTVGNLDGDLDEVRISRATLDPLHPTKTRELVSDEDTVALYRFDPNTDDYSGNEYHFTTTGGAEIPCIDHGWVQASSSSGLLLYAPSDIAHVFYTKWSALAWQKEFFHIEG